MLIIKMVIMKTESLVKLAIVLFIIYAIYNGNRSTIKGWASKVSSGIASFKSASPQRETKNDYIAKPVEAPAMTTASPAVQQAPGSMFSNITANVVNQILDNPNGRKIFEAVLAKSLQQNGPIVNELKASPHQTLVKDVKLETGQDIRCTCTVHK